MRRRASQVAVVVGVLLIVAAAVVRWVAAPMLAVLPADTDTRRLYQGTAAVLLNAEAVTTGTGQAVLRDVPIEVQSRSTVLDTDGDSALVSLTRVVSAVQQRVAETEYRYAVDRTDLQRGSGFRDVTRQDGITFNWPIRSEKKDYRAWVADIGRSTTLEYQRTEDRGGVSTNVFTATTDAQPITDEQVLATLPQALPKATITKLVPTLGLPIEQLLSMQELLPTLPDPVPFSYTFSLDSTYWVEPDSGVVVDLDQRQVRTANLAAGPTPVPIAPIFDVRFGDTPQTLALAADDAASKGGSVRMVYGTLPLGLLAAGLLVLLAGLVSLLTTRRHPPATPARRTPERTPVP